MFACTMPFTAMRPAELYALRREYDHPQWPASDPLDAPNEEDREERHADDIKRYGPNRRPRCGCGGNTNGKTACWDCTRRSTRAGGRSSCHRSCGAPGTAP